MSKVDITLIIATYNGEATLPMQLESINNINVEADLKVNIIYVDNNSNDKTSSLLKSFKSKFPIYTLFEPSPGKNKALNTALESNVELGELLIFSDDDVIYPSTFFSKYYQLFKSQASYQMFGGKVDAHWPFEPNQNLIEGIDAVVAFAITPKSAGYESGEIDPIKLHGPNMAIVKKMFANGFRFNENIGPNGGNYVMGSETDILYRLKAQNCKAYFSADIAVNHIIRPIQFSTKWIASRAFKAGRSLVHHHKNQKNQTKVKIMLGYPRWAVVRYIKLSCLLFAYFPVKSKRFYELLWTQNHLKGYLFEFKKLGS